MLFVFKKKKSLPEIDCSTLTMCCYGSSQNETKKKKKDSAVFSNTQWKSILAFGSDRLTALFLEKGSLLK